MEREDDLFYIAGGAVAALLLGMLLVPFRELTTAAHFTFPFVALTIAIAEFGGRRAAFVTALVSALSLDFFLTRPYGKLSIEAKEDFVAFLGLTVCGLLAAAFGSKRRRRTRAPEHLELLHRALAESDRDGPLGPALEGILELARSVLPLRAAVVRSVEGDILAASRGARTLPEPRAVVTSVEEPRGFGSPWWRPAPPLAAEGVRIPLAVGNREAGTLEVWGNGRPARTEMRRTLTDLARVLGPLLLARVPELRHSEPMEAP